jgi:hypothetical protein
MTVPSLDTTQGIVTLIGSLSVVVTLGWKLFDTISKAFERKMLRELYEAEVEWKDYYKSREADCRSQLSQCRENGR